MPPTGADTLPDDAPWGRKLEMLLLRFKWDFEKIEQFQRVVEREVQAGFERGLQKLEANLDPETDEGDVYWQAGQRLGADSLDVAAHTGLIAISRAVALAEVAFADVAATFLTDPEGLVYIGSKSWSRAEADDFYWTVLDRKVKLRPSGFKSITDLRDLYAHGYGRPVNAGAAQQLAGKLHRLVGDAPATEEERRLGFQDDLFYFGRWDGYAADRSLTEHTFMPLVAELSPLVTYRLLQLVKAHVRDVVTKASYGPKAILNADTSRFVRKWAERQPGHLLHAPTGTCRSVQNRLDDAEALWALGRREGALLSLLVAVTAAARFEHGQPDGEAFVRFLQGRHEWRIDVEHEGALIPVDELLWTWARCEMVHRGGLPGSVQFAVQDGATDGGLFVRAGGEPDNVVLLSAGWFGWLREQVDQWLSNQKP